MSHGQPTPGPQGPLSDAVLDERAHLAAWRYYLAAMDLAHGAVEGDATAAPVAALAPGEPGNGSPEGHASADVEELLQELTTLRKSDVPEALPGTEATGHDR
jgi:hypothetical protein